MKALHYLNPNRRLQVDLNQYSKGRVQYYFWLMICDLFEDLKAEVRD